MAALDHAQVIFSAILPDRKDLLIRSVATLDPEHFRDEISRRLFELLKQYYEMAGDVLPPKVLEDLLENQNVDASRQLLYMERFNAALETSVEDHEYRYATSALKEQREKQLTGEAIATAYEVLEAEAIVDGQTLRGAPAARQLIYSEFSRIDKMGNQESAPEGDARDERDEIMKEYAEKKAGKAPAPIQSGIEHLDGIMGGFYPGELDLIAAYTSQGKSQLLTQIAWHAAIMQGKNVYFSTSETLRVQIRRRIIARHSKHTMFNFPEGLNVTAIKNGSLTDDQEAVFNQVVEDLHYNKTYGKLFISQIPRGTTFGQWEAAVKRQSDVWDIDLLCMDYLALLKPDRNRGSAREEAVDILRDAKVFATSIYDGKGVPLLSPWQMNMNSYKQAIESGDGYSLASLADTSEAEKTSDTIISILRMPDEKREVSLQVLKNRDGETPPSFKVSVDYKCAYFGSVDYGSDDVADLLNF